MTAANANDGFTSNKRPDLFMNKVILAPMVRENSLPFRLLCLQMGADLVYSEELIDYRLSSCRRLENKCLGTVDFVDDRGDVIFRTCSQEKDKLVIQLGSNNPDRALKAALIVSNDALAIDFNFGCPKSFSLSGGMGAALLEKPAQIKALLTNCVKNLKIPVTCKMRILPRLEDTIELVKMIELCGVSAIAVHGRTKEQRPNHENNDDFLREIARGISIPMIANGGSNAIKNYSDAVDFKRSTEASSVMIARAAMKNPSVFKSDNSAIPNKVLITEFLKLAVRYDNCVANTKYTISALMANGHHGSDFIYKFHAAPDLKTMSELFNIGNWYDENKVSKNKREYYGDELEDKELTDLIVRKRKKLLSEGMDFIYDNIPYKAKMYGTLAPKSQLMNHANKQPLSKPEFNVFESGSHSYLCLVRYGNFCYLNKAYSNSKKNSEHATAMLVCERLGLVDLEDYKKRTNGNNRNIN